MKPITKTLYTIGLIVVALLTVFITNNVKNNQLAKQKLELRKQIIKNDSLQKLADGLYTKRVADTATIKDLRQLNDSLKLELKNPKVVVVTKIQPKDQEGEVDSVSVEQDSISITDYYPDKDNPFVSYFAKIDIPTQKGIGKFSFNEFDLNLGITQNKDGTYSLNTQLPEFMTVNSINVQSLPMDIPKPDNFGWLLGVKGNYSFEDQSLGYEVIGGIRFKKVNVITTANTQKQVGAGLIFEF